MDDSIRKINDEIQSAVEKLVSRIGEDLNDDPDYTGREIKGKGSTDIKIALVDNVTEDPVDSGLESSRTNV
ncbi:Hypothetical predicted protein [Olea europaea subsp. europaea]|uniref:Uncharacterized protein n=1 Tax=Olea europaea subsp. europaea TaxID=158383 RepID=A0A8S0U523_OLEEU|nr:Hypothetical predicted protein [Olea europaea subsp. europaea]